MWQTEEDKMQRATMNQYLQIGARINNGKIDFETAKALIEGKFLRPVPGDGLMVMVGTITVPKLSAVDLIARAERCGIKVSAIRSWDFYQPITSGNRSRNSIVVPGRRYEVLLLKPGDKILSMAKVQERFKKVNADGNNGAFITWLMVKRPHGCFVTIPSDRRQLVYDQGYPYALHYQPEDFFSIHSMIEPHSVQSNREGTFWSYVGFREVPA
jgi:hypothetical protein